MEKVENQDANLEKNGEEGAESNVEEKKIEADKVEEEKQLTTFEKGKVHWISETFKERELTKKLKAENSAFKGEEENSSSEFLTKKDIQLGNERKAVRIATKPQSNDDEATIAIKKEIDAHWGEIITHYSRDSKNILDVDEVVERIYDAHAAWARRNKTMNNSNDKKTLSDLQTDKGFGGKAGESGTGSKVPQFPVSRRISLQEIYKAKVEKK